jgi:hypothetical protein
LVKVVAGTAVVAGTVVDGSVEVVEVAGVELVQAASATANDASPVPANLRTETTIPPPSCPRPREAPASTTHAFT